MAMDHLKLMIPGPMQPEDDVLEAMGSPVLPHYGPQFTQLYCETIDMLKRVFGTQDDAFLIVGSGTAGIDACLGSALASGEKLIVATNGWFGDRLKCVAEEYLLNVVTVRGDLDRPLSPAAIDAALAAHPDAKLVAMCHVETSTTIVNPVAEIGAVVRRRGAHLMVDAVSSLGGVPMKMDEWGIDLCASASQKCLGAPPGLSPVGVGRRGWALIDRQPHKGHGWYLNLRVWQKFATEWADWHPFPISMATSNVMAIRTSLSKLLAEGIETRLERYRQLALQLRQGLRRIGMPPYTPDELMSPVVTAAYGPPGVPTGRIVQYMAEVHHIKIAGGLGEGLKDKVFRIGHMAPTVSASDIEQVLKALEGFQAERKA